MINTRDMTNSKYWQNLADEYYNLYRQFYEMWKSQKDSYKVVVFKDPLTNCIVTKLKKNVIFEIMGDCSQVAAECRKKAELWRVRENLIP